MRNDIATSASVTQQTVAMICTPDLVNATRNPYTKSQELGLPWMDTGEGQDEFGVTISVFTEE